MSPPQPLNLPPPHPTFHHADPMAPKALKAHSGATKPSFVLFGVFSPSILRLSLQEPPSSSPNQPDNTLPPKPTATGHKNRPSKQWHVH
ncbi:hypothetical protein NQZ68_007070 [Dissostichus eleginoides]|nr:hypothetical protein NQZ68_007070 [Dissostichus eleginoides]